MGRCQTNPRPDRSGRLIGLTAGVAYALAYLYSVQNIVVAPGADLVAGAPVPAVSIVAEWSAKIWKPIVPFVWEPVVAIYPLRWVAVFLSVPNLLVAGVLAALVGLNVSVAAAQIHVARTRGSQAGSVKGLVASVPGLLTGFACCVPTVVLALGSLAAGFTAAVIAVRPYFIPAAALALTANLLWGMRRLRCSLGEAGPRSPGMEHPASVNERV